MAEQSINLLVCTSTLAWGVNFPAHLVVIKGTGPRSCRDRAEVFASNESVSRLRLAEYFDAKVNRYVDMPVTDVLQMMGRAGRPQYDQSGVAMVLVHDKKKTFYRKCACHVPPARVSTRRFHRKRACLDGTPTWWLGGAATCAHVPLRAGSFTSRSPSSRAYTSSSTTT